MCDELTGLFSPHSQPRLHHFRRRSSLFRPFLFSDAFLTSSPLPQDVTTTPAASTVTATATPSTSTVYQTSVATVTPAVSTYTAVQSVATGSSFPASSSSRPWTDIVLRDMRRNRRLHQLPPRSSPFLPSFPSFVHTDPPFSRRSTPPPAAPTPTSSSHPAPLPPSSVAPSPSASARNSSVLRNERRSPRP